MEYDNGSVRVKVKWILLGSLLSYSWTVPSISSGSFNLGLINLSNGFPMSFATHAFILILLSSNTILQNISLLIHIYQRTSASLGSCNAHSNQFVRSWTNVWWGSCYTGSLQAPWSPSTRSSHQQLILFPSIKKLIYPIIRIIIYLESFM